MDLLGYVLAQELELPGWGNSGQGAEAVIVRLPLFRRLLGRAKAGALGGLLVRKVVSDPVVLLHVASGQGAEERRHVGRGPRNHGQLRLAGLLPGDDLGHLSVFLVRHPLEVAVGVGQLHELHVGAAVALHVLGGLL